MTAQMAKNKNAKIEMLETKVKLFNTEEKFETKIHAKKAKIESENIVENKRYIGTYFIMSIYILFNKKKDHVNELIQKYYAIAKDYYC